MKKLPLIIILFLTACMSFRSLGQGVTRSGKVFATLTAQDSTRFVTLNGDQTIAGNKTFTGTVSGVSKSMVGLGNVDNTSDANKPVSTATQSALDLKAPLASPSFTGTVSGITAAMVGLGNVNNTSDANKPISTATQTALNLKLDAADSTKFLTKINTKLNAADTTKLKAYTDARIAAIPTATKSSLGLGNVDNTSDANKPVSTATQSALNLKAPLASPSFTGTVSGITAAMVGLGNVNNTSDANKPISTATQTALNLKLDAADSTKFLTKINTKLNAADTTKLKAYTDARIAAIPTATKSSLGLGNVDNTSDAAKPISTATQSALDLKAPLASPSFTGTVSGITAAMVGLGNVNNTSDANKPVSTATQSALDLKAPLASPSFTGTVSGITAAMVGLGNVNNTSDANKPISTATQTALNLKLDAADSTKFLTKINTKLNATDTTKLKAYTDARIAAIPATTKSSIGLGNVENTSDAAKPISTATQAALDLKAPLASPSFTGTVSGITAAMVGLGNVNNTSDANKPVSTATQTALNLKLDAADSTKFLTKINTKLNAADTTKLKAYTDARIAAIPTATKASLGLGNVDNTSDANKPVSTATQSALDLKAPLASPSFTGTVSGITAAMVGLGNVNNTSDADKPVSSATLTALNLKLDAADSTKFLTKINTKLNAADTTKLIALIDEKLNTSDTTDLAARFVRLTTDQTIAGNKTFTGTVSGISKSMVGLGEVDNTSDLNKPISTATQAALDGKANLHSPHFTGAPTAITATTGSSNAQIATTEFVQNGLNSVFIALNGVFTGFASSTDATISAFANDVNSRVNAFANDINASLSGKLDLVDTTKSVRIRGDQTIAGNKTFTGTVSGITKAMVGLGNVDNTSDANKPVSTATQTALNLRAPLASPAFTGTPTAPTASAGTNTTQVATTAFVQTGLDLRAPLASPALTGIPTAPTASAGTNTTQLATTAFVQTGLGGRLPLSDTTKSVRLTGDQVVGGMKTFGDMQLTKSIKWLSPRQNIDWDFITIDSAVFYSGVPYRNFAIRVKAPVGPGYKQFTFNPNGDFYASGTVYPSGGIYVASGDIYTGRDLTVAGDATVSGRISVQNGTSTQALMADGSLKKYSLYDDVVTVNGVATTLQGVGLRTTTPSALFEINSTGYGANNALKLTSSNSVVIHVNTTGDNWIGTTYNRNGEEKWFIGMPNSNSHLFFNGTGNVGIGNGTPVNKLEVQGSIRASGSVISNTTTLTSDRRLKSNIKDLKANAMTTLKQLRPVEYDKKDSILAPNAGNHEYGFIAQEVQKVLPALVTEGKDKDKILHLNYTALIPFLTQAIKEKDAEIQALKKQVEMLQKSQETTQHELQEIKELLKKIPSSVR